MQSMKQTKCVLHLDVVRQIFNTLHFGGGGAGHFSVPENVCLNVSIHVCHGCL